MKGYSTRTGPTLTKQVAEALREKGFRNVWEGTEKVYFLLPEGRVESWEEANRALWEVFPSMTFKVEYEYKNAHWA